MKTLNLTQGKIALVDDEDYENLNQWKWFAFKAPNTWYAVRSYYDKVAKKNYTIRLHRQIMNCVKGDDKLIDHADMDGLNCQKYNLRIATKSQNNANRRNIKLKSSKYKGVSWCNTSKKWKVQISIDNKVIHIGRYETEKEAALKYNEKAIELHKEFANLNTIENE